MKELLRSNPRFDSILEVIQRRTGLTPASSRRKDFEASITKAMTRAGVTDATTFIHYIDNDAHTLDALVEDLTVAETYFFREPAQFDMLRQQILPNLLNNCSDSQLSIWSAGCASGEEAYSLAILLEQSGLADRATILGTDIARSALKLAQTGAYGTWSFRGCSADFVSRYFHRRDDRFVLLQHICRRVEFRYLNLASSPYPSGLDLIMCRNVLIYFEREIIERVAQQLFAALREGGWLIAGPSDPPLWDFAPFETVVTSGGVFYRRSRITSPRLVARSQSELYPPGLRLPSSVSVMPPAALAHPAVEVAAAPYDVLAEAQSAFKTGDLSRVLELTRTTTDDAQVSALRARTLANLGDCEVAAAFAAEAVLIHPLSPELHYLRAIILMSLGRHAEVIAVLRRVIYLDRSLAVAHFTLGALLSRLGAVDQARLCYQNVVTLCAGRPQEEIVPLSEGERTGHLAEAARVQLARTKRNAAATL